MFKQFLGEKILSSVEMGPKMAVFWENGVETLDFGFATPKRDFLARNRVV